MDGCRTQHWWGTYRTLPLAQINPGPADFAHRGLGKMLRRLLKTPGVNVAVASFGRGDVIRKAIGTPPPPRQHCLSHHLALLPSRSGLSSIFFFFSRCSSRLARFPPSLSDFLSSSSSPTGSVARSLALFFTVLRSPWRVMIVMYLHCRRMGTAGADSILPPALSNKIFITTPGVGLALYFPGFLRT